MRELLGAAGGFVRTGCLAIVVLVGIACQPDGAPSGDTRYLADLLRPVSITRCGQLVGLSCHNCYYDDDDDDDSNEQATKTIAILERAIDANVDLLELDLRLSASGLIVEHDADDMGASFASVLLSKKLREASQPLFLEIKEPFSDTAASQSLLRELFVTLRRAEKALEARARFPKFVRQGRPLFVRAIQTKGDGSAHRHLAQVDAIAAEFPELQPHVRTHVLFGARRGADSGARLDEIWTQAQQGLDAVEFEYTQPNLPAALMAAKLMGLGVGIYTLPAAHDAFGKTVLASVREQVDFITADFVSAADSVEPEARAVLSEPTTLFYMDVGEQLGFPLRYSRCDGASGEEQAVASSTSPVLEVLTTAEGGDLPGGSLVFSGGQHITALQQGGLDVSSGVLLHVIAKFDPSTLTSDATSTLLAAADGGFYLQLTPHGPQRVLRFGVRDRAHELFAECAVSQLDPTNAYTITATFDGSHTLQLWIDHQVCGVALGDAMVQRSESALIIGAEALDRTARHNFFRGKIRQILVQRRQQRSGMAGRPPRRNDGPRL